MRLATLLLSAAVLATGVTASAATPSRQARAEAKLETLLAGRVPGKPVRCIDLHRIDGSQIIDGTAIVYRNGSRLYVNRPQTGASFLDSDDILLTKSWGSQLCRIDTVRLLDRSSRFPRGFVGLGDFVPYTAPKPARS